MTHGSRIIARILCLAGCIATLDAAETFHGRLFHIDPANRSFHLLRETEYDPQKDLTPSRYACRWQEGTTIRKITEVGSFAGIKGPIWAKLQGIDASNQTAVENGQPFTVRVATLIEGMDQSLQASVEKNEVSGWFTPNDGAGDPAGSIRIGGKEVPVRMREKHRRIWHHSLVPPEQLTAGFWHAELTATEENGILMVSQIDATPLADPRNTDDPRLPRILVIGDSISMNYHEAAKLALDGTANYHRIEGNSFSSDHGVVNTELWLGDYAGQGLHWDVIQFNHGLHDLKQSYDQASGNWGPYAVPLDRYKANLEKQIALLRQSGARLIWCTTTPVPNDNLGTYARKKGAAEVFNTAALEVMKRHPDILINDLHGMIAQSDTFDAWRTGKDVHFYRDTEQRALGEAVAGVVRQALVRELKKLPLPGESFAIAGSQAFIIPPAGTKRNTPTPWVWYAPTLPGLPSQAETWMFQQFLDHGIAVAGIDVGESMGNPAGRAKFHTFYREMTENRHFSTKPCLLARSRGGLMLYNWAVEHPDCLCAIAGIYPVGNPASWPGVPKASRAYAMDEKAFAARLPDHSPGDRLAPLVASKIPLFHIHGDNDRVVPLEQNSGLLHQRYTAAGGTMRLKVIPGGGHDMNDHWFRDQELVDFIIAAAGSK